MNTVGATPRRLDAMLHNKNNKAAVLNEPFAIQAVRGGLKDLGTTVSMMGPYQGTAGYTTAAWAKNNRDTLVNYLAAYIEGLRWILDPANKEASTKMIADGLDLSPDIAAECYQIVTDENDGFAKDGRFDLTGFKNVLSLRADYEGNQLPPPGEYLDLQAYQRALAGL